MDHFVKNVHPNLFIGFNFLRESLWLICKKKVIGHSKLVE